MSDGISSFLFGNQVVPPQPQASDTQVSTPVWLQDYYSNIGSAASQLASQPYTPYPGQQIATPSAQTQQSWQMAGQNANSYQPQLQQAGALTSEAANPIGASQINQYMNPYQSYITGALNTNLMQNTLPQVQSQFIGAGQQGSPQDQQSLNNAIYQNQQAVGQSLASGYSGALSAAEQQQQMEQTAGAQMGNLGALSSELGAQNTGLVAGAGQSQDTINQANINSSMNNFYQQQQWPYENIGFLSNAVRGEQLPTTSQTTQLQYNPYTTSTASPLQTAVGATSIASSLGLKKGGHVHRFPVRERQVMNGALSRMAA